MSQPLSSTWVFKRIRVMIMISDKHSVQANYQDNKCFTMKECHRPPGRECLCHTLAIVVSYAQKQICQIQTSGTPVKKRWRSDQTRKTWQWWSANSERVYTSHTTNRIPTQTRIPFCFTVRVHDLSHAGLSCISSTHDQEFKAPTRNQNARLLYYN